MPYADLLILLLKLHTRHTLQFVRHLVKAKASSQKMLTETNSCRDFSRAAWSTCPGMFGPMLFKKSLCFAWSSFLSAVSKQRLTPHAFSVEQLNNWFQSCLNVRNLLFVRILKTRMFDYYFFTAIGVILICHTAAEANWSFLRWLNWKRAGAAACNPGVVRRRAEICAPFDMLLCVLRSTDCLLLLKPLESVALLILHEMRIFQGLR